MCTDIKTQNKDLKLELFKVIGSLRQNVTCAICSNILNEPVSLYCHHSYCKICYVSLFERSSDVNAAQCPSCKKDLKQGEFYKNNRIEAVVEAVKSYVNIVAHYKICEGKEIIPSDVAKTNNNKLKTSKSTEIEYVALPVEKNLTKTKSLECISDDSKFLSKANNENIEKQISVNERPQYCTDYDRKIIDLMEEDCLANLENEFRNASTFYGAEKAVKKPSKGLQKKKGKLKKRSGNDHNTSTSSSDTGWSRMKKTNKHIERKKMKQLNISTFSVISKRESPSNKSDVENKSNSKKKEASTKSVFGEKTNIANDSIATKKSPRTPSYKLDQFESYLQEKLGQSVDKNKADTGTVDKNKDKVVKNQKNKKTPQKSEIEAKKLISPEKSLKITRSSKKKQKLLDSVDHSTTKDNGNAVNIKKLDVNIIELDKNKENCKNIPNDLLNTIDLSNEVKTGINISHIEKNKSSSKNVNVMVVPVEVHTHDKQTDNSASSEDDIFEISTQKLSNTVKNNENTNVYLNSDNIYDVCTQKLNETIVNQCEPEDINLKNTSEISIDLKKRKIDSVSNVGSSTKRSEKMLKTEENNEVSKKGNEKNIQSRNDKIITPTDQDIPNTFIVENSCSVDKCLLPERHVDNIVNSGKMENIYTKAIIYTETHSKNELPTLQNPDHKFVKEFLSFLTNSESLFSSITQKGTSEHITHLYNQYRERQAHFSQIQSLPNLSSNENVVNFYNTAIPYLSNLRKLYSDFKLIVNDIKTNTLSLSQLFGQNVNSLGNAKDISGSTIQDFMDEKQICEVALQTDSEIKCPKCFHIFNIQYLDDINDPLASSEIDNNFHKDASKNSVFSDERVSDNNINKKVSRQLIFDQDTTLKRMRSQSPELELAIQKKAKRTNTDAETYEDLSEMFVSDMCEANQSLLPQQINNDQIKQILGDYKKKIIDNKDNKTTQDVTTTYVSILEREYKELDVHNIDNPLTKIKTTQLESTENEHQTKFTEPKFPETEHRTKSTEFKFTKTEPQKSTELKTQNIPKKLESQFSKSLFTESDKFFTATLLNNSLQHVDKPKGLTEKEQLSLSLFTETTKKIPYDSHEEVENDHNSEKASIVTSPQDIFSNQEVHREVDADLEDNIIEDSLDSAEVQAIFNNINIVESTPQKDVLVKRKFTETKTKTKLDDLITEVRKQSNDTQPDVNWENDEFFCNIAPPPEFQDSSVDKTKDLENIHIDEPRKSNTTARSTTPDFLLLTPEDFSSSSALNKRIDELPDSERNESYIEISLSAVKDKKITNRSLASACENDMDRVASTRSVKKHLNTSIPKNTNSSFTHDTMSALTIVKTTNYVPKTVIPSTPKQTSIFNFIKASSSQQKKTPLNKSVDKTPSRETKNTHTFDDKMEITPLKSEPLLSQNMCIACTRLSKEENAMIVSLTTKYNLSYSKQFTDKVTHLIVLVDDQNRIKDHTMKYISAVANGIWILSFLWVQESLTYERLMPEDSYEVLDVSGAPGPTRSRLTRTTNPLLKNFVFYCAEPFLSVTKKDLETVVTALGAETVNSLDDLKSKNKIRLILTEAKISQDFDQYQIWVETLKIITVDIEWLSRTIGQYQISSIRPFMLCLDEGIENFGYPPFLIAAVPETLTECTGV